MNAIRRRRESKNVREMMHYPTTSPIMHLGRLLTIRNKALEIIK